MEMLSIDYGLCAGCGACAEMYPLFFEIRDEKAWIVNYEKFSVEEYRRNPVICPYRAIIIE
jgi:ferredoxin